MTTGPRLLRHPSGRREASVACLVLAILAATSACKEVSADERVFDTEVTLTAMEDDADIARVTITPRGASQIGLETAEVTEAGGRRRIPYAALLYAADGQHAYVYVESPPLSFHREDVVVDRVQDDRVIISEGPTAGTRVATQGVPQIHGAELELGKY